MGVTRQSDSFLPERDPGVHEYRASLFSVFLHTDPRGDASLALPPEMRPLPLSEAIDVIHQLPGERIREGMATALFKLTSSVLIEQRDEFIPPLAQLLGTKVGTPEAFRKALTQRVQESMPENIPVSLRTLSYDHIRNFAYQGLASGTREAPLDPSVYTPEPMDPEPPQQKQEAQARFTREPIALPEGKPESRVNLETLVTTVDITSVSRCDFDVLARTLDPRSWGPSPFWPECFQVDFSKDKRDFVPSPPDDPPRGMDWKGLLFEHVEWNWNPLRVASFRNFLNIKYIVDVPSQTIDMRFSLFSCEGSELFAVSFDRGIDVDVGFQTVKPLQAPPARGPPFQLQTVKNIRYSDLLDRRIRTPAPAGSGQILSYMAPIVVGLWMNELVKKLYC